MQKRERGFDLCFSSLCEGEDQAEPEREGRSGGKESETEGPRSPSKTCGERRRQRGGAGRGEETILNINNIRVEETRGSLCRKIFSL